ncbi:hypothetical protein V1264_017716 [Littorina saxatilis]|uniref:MAM domain-containing protein n=1 Tax=Littorina saxatilis TaxID=31220 RepID=A0AAN9BHY1_9CAEN
MSDQSRSSFLFIRLLCLVLSLVNIATANGQETGDCNFDTIKTTRGPLSGDTCGWRHFFTETGLLEWKTWNRQTITTGTGPTADHTTGKSYYIFCEGKDWRSHTDRNVVGYLRSPLLPSHTSAKCMHFWYHMYGTSTKNLTIFFSSTSVKWKQMFSENDQLNAWRSGRFTITAPAESGPYQIIIMAASYSDVIVASDIAIDDISFSNGPCQDCVGKRWHNGVRCVPCGYCVDDQKCAGDGLCSSCKHGYKQAKCIDCADNSYNDGSGCTPCGQCDRGRTCNDRSGLCDACRIGWKMPLCQS